jgi:hypothetical protein
MIRFAISFLRLAGFTTQALQNKSWESRMATP